MFVNYTALEHHYNTMHYDRFSLVTI